MTRVQALALEQIRDQILHFPNVLENAIARLLVVDELGRHLGARQRRSQFVTDREEQLLLGLQHFLDIVRHPVDVPRQRTEIVAARFRDAVVEIAGANARRALLDPAYRADEPGHREEATGENDQRQDADQRRGQVRTRIDADLR